MNADRLWPVVIVQDRYHGEYSGGAWIAVAQADVPSGAIDLFNTRASFILENGPNDEDDEIARDFWKAPLIWIVAGSTPDEAVKALLARYHATG